MNLTKYNLKHIPNGIVEIPGSELFDLPEKVLQFGTGVLLRGLPDYLIDMANKQGFFNGRIVVIKSTSKGNADTFEKQDGLYTTCVRGIKNGEKIEYDIINSSISRVLSANENWPQILECASNPSMKIIISNTTEVGIQFVNDNISLYPPVSFPGKLLAFLYRRYKAFNGSINSGMIIIPTELIVDNGKILKSIVFELAHLNGLEESFIEWLENFNHFCNSLVDRIVPGKPENATKKKIEDILGYNDELLIITEDYKLWAIEGDDHIKNILSFSNVDDGIIIQPDIELFRELKLRILNGAHTLSCGLSVLCRYESVRDAMVDEAFDQYISKLLVDEIIPSIPFDIDPNIAIEFAKKVLDRFRNPYISHQWLSISVQYSSKMKLRCVPLLINHYKNNSNSPELFALGFAAYIYFMKPVKFQDNVYYGVLDNKSYAINDDSAEEYYNRWKTHSPKSIVQEVLKDIAFWGHDLYLLPGFKDSVLRQLEFIINNGAKEAIIFAQSKKVLA